MLLLFDCLFQNALSNLKFLNLRYNNLTTLPISPLKLPKDFFYEGEPSKFPSYLMGKEDLIAFYEIYSL
jgi:hypothetical protein